MGASAQMPNGKCWMHGGASPGAPRGEGNAMFRHGLRSTEAIERRRKMTAEIRGRINAASFTEIANRPTTTTASLVAVIQTRHPKMSPGATRSSSEAADLAAYILTLKQQK